MSNRITDGAIAPDDFVLLAHLACHAPAALLYASSGESFRVLSALGWPGPPCLARDGV